jgi:hypothetical protein
MTKHNGDFDFAAMTVTQLLNWWGEIGDVWSENEAVRIGNVLLRRARAVGMSRADV